MKSHHIKQISKRLSYVLRHAPESIGIELSRGGWTSVDQLLDALARSGFHVSLETLENVITENDKQRFELSGDLSLIRARQGHSVQIEMDYEPVKPPDMLYHGTATRFLESILEHGLIKGTRQHVHLSTNYQTMVQVGSRHGKPVVLSIDAKSMFESGHEFFVTGNHVWLTEHVPPDFLSRG